MTDNQQLLADYRQHGSDAAFRELVTRFVGLVYSTALRLVGGDTHQAEDVTQIVFVDLAREARTLSADVRLGGWLHRHTCFVAANALRGERRRQARERQAVEMNALQNHPEADFSHVAPLLDEAINELAEVDRTAILLRFFEQQDFRAVGAALGGTEDAARMRVTRALEKLEEFLKRRGVKTTAASLGVALTANAIQAVPVGLADKIAAAAVLAGTTITTTTAAVMTTLQKTIIGATLVAAVGAGIYEARQASNARAEVQALKEHQAGQIQQLARERDAVLSAATANGDELERLRKNQNELLRLRSEIGLLRRQTNELGKLRPAAKATTVPEAAQADPQIAPRERMPRLARLIARPLLMYAAENQGRFPTNFAEAAPFFQKAAQQAEPFLGDERDLVEATNHFEITFYGSRDTLTDAGSVILLRERLARQRPDGYWERAYVKASGTVSVAVSPDGNFETREKELQTVPTGERPQAIIVRP